MATVQVGPHSVSVRFTRAEKVLGLMRDMEVPRAAIRSADVESDGLRATRGLRAPGLAVPGRRKIGTWLWRGQRTAVSVRAHQPALHLQIRHRGYDALLIGTDEAEAIAAELAPVAG